MPVVDEPNEPHQANSARVSSRGNKAFSLRSMITFLGIRSASRASSSLNFLVFPAADHAMVRRHAHVQVGIRGLPDETLRRPQRARLGTRGDGPGREDPVLLASHRLGHLVAGGKDQGLATDHRPVFRARFDRPARGVDVADLHGRVQARAARDGCPQEPARMASRVGREIVVAQESAPAANAEPLARPRASRETSYSNPSVAVPRPRAGARRDRARFRTGTANLDRPGPPGYRAAAIARAAHRPRAASDATCARLFHAQLSPPASSGACRARTGSSDVDAAVEPRTAPRRSTTTTRSPASDTISAYQGTGYPRADDAVHRTTMSRTSVDSAIRGHGRDCQID